MAGHNCVCVTFPSNENKLLNGWIAQVCVEVHRQSDSWLIVLPQYVCADANLATTLCRVMT